MLVVIRGTRLNSGYLKKKVSQKGVLGCFHASPYCTAGIMVLFLSTIWWPFEGSRRKRLVFSFLISAIVKICLPCSFYVNTFHPPDDLYHISRSFPWDFSEGPVANTLHSQCRGPGTRFRIPQLNFLHVASEDPVSCN